MDFKLHTLANGLRLVHSHVDSTAMVAMNVLYNTGARDEDPGLTGIAHLLEHMMFGGSANVPDFDKVLSAAGGIDNAWTSNDFTSFWDVAPAHNAETLFYLESDRMRAPLFPDEGTAIQKSVVIEEFKQQCINRPYGRSAHYLRQMLYDGAHPYSWPVIGKTPDHVAAATSADLHRMFRQNYAPGNAVLAVTGNIDFDLACRWAEKWFADIAPRPVPAHDFVPVAPLDAPRRFEVTDKVPATMITLAWLMDPYGTEGYTAGDALTDILAAGNASRFYRRLIVDGPGWFTDADASISGSEHEGFLMINARLADESVDIESAERLLVDEALKLCGEDIPSEHEVRRLINRQDSLFTLGNIDSLSLAQTLAMAVIHNEAPDAQLLKYRALTPEILRSHASRIFGAPHATLITRPSTQEQ